MAQSRRCRSPFVFFDTEFPSCIFRTSKHHTKLSTAERYSVLKLNADVIRPIQVGLTVSNGGTSTATGQFEIRDIDLRCHPHAPSSIALLKSSGINLTRNRQLGAFCLTRASSGTSAKQRGWLSTDAMIYPSCSKPYLS
ncbi:hypothetical protein M5K25_021246 [Dendrobium thyrsiflorum]|uniref:Uncharacterized protein n=1 Tax=Dendrobium thyrsiflorum TaxID=117978 RepID=A0ABD0UIY5_DENTH